jgi:hypothetical protein
MDSEDESRQPSARYIELSQDPPDKQRVRYLQGNVDGVITRCVLAENMMLGPEDRVCDGKIIRGSSAGPDLR